MPKKLFLLENFAAIGFDGNFIVSLAYFYLPTCNCAVFCYVKDFFTKSFALVCGSAICSWVRSYTLILILGFIQTNHLPPHILKLLLKQRQEEEERQIRLENERNKCSIRVRVAVTPPNEHLLKYIESN